MRVIKPDEIEVTCSTCRAVLGVYVTDIKTDVSGHRGYYCHCINCGSVVDISSEAIPRRWTKDIGW
jgi:hypothetical protein